MGSNVVFGSRVVLITNIDFTDLDISAINEINVISGGYESYQQVLYKIFTLGGGYYFDQNLFLALTYTFESFSTVNRQHLQGIFVDESPIIITMSGKKLLDISNGNTVNIEAGVSVVDYKSAVSDSYKEISVSTDYYFTNKFSLGFQFKSTDQLNADNEMAYNTSYFYHGGNALILDYVKSGEISTIQLSIRASF